MPISQRASGYVRLRGAARPTLAAIVALVALSLCAASASAVIVHLPGGKTLSYLPMLGAPSTSAQRASRFDEVFSNLDYNGGPVMPSNTNHTFYWSPSGAGAYPAGYQKGVDRFLTDLAHDSGGNQNVDSVSTQYNDAAGEFAKYKSEFAGPLEDTDPYPANGCASAPKCLTDAQIQQELAAYVSAHKLPTGLTQEYFVLLPPEIETCFEPAGEICSADALINQEFCAYHGNIPFEGTQIIYANDPFVTGNAGCDDGNHPNESPSDGVIQGGLSHEHNESITDPEPNNAWADFGGGGGAEIGDKCRDQEADEFGTQLGTAEDGSPYNQLINGDKYWYQTEWSNQEHKCEQRFTPNATVPTASFAITAGSGDQVTFSSAASTGATRYNWQFNDGGTPGTPFETPETSVTHVFPALGSYVVALTAFAPDGASSGAAETIVVGALPAAAFSVLPAAPTAGQQVTFDGSQSSDPHAPIVSYAWTFGDGTGANGSAPTHVYAAAGRYDATVTITDATGTRAAATHTVEVAAAPTPSGGSAEQPTSNPPGSSAPITVLTATIAKVAANRRGGATVLVVVSAAGVLSATETHHRGRALVRAVRLALRSSGQATIHVMPSSAGLRILRRRHRLTVSLLVRFGSSSHVVRVTLLLPRHAH